MVRKTAHHFNWFERGWNSTLGIPEQIVRRLWRVAQGDASLLSEEGLVDASLLPVIGAFDMRRGDVSDQEFIQRINQTFGADLDPDNIATAIGVGLFTDPLSYLTGGATALAKAGRASAVVGRNTAVHRLGASINPGGTVDDVLKIADEALRVADPAEKRELARAMADLRQVDPGESLFKAQVNETQKQLMVAVPFLERFQAARFKTLDPKHKSWWSLANRGVGKGLAVAANIGAPLAQLPGMDLVLEPLAQVGHAYKLSKEAAGQRLAISRADSFGQEISAKRGAEVAEALLEAEPLHARINDSGGVTSVLSALDDLHSAALYREAGDARHAAKLDRMSNDAKFLRAVGETVPRSKDAQADKAASVWRRMGGGNKPIPASAEELESVLRPFMDDTAALIDEANEATIKRAPTKAFDALKDAKSLGRVGKSSFAFFDAFRRTRSKLFRTDFASGTTEFLEAERTLRKDVARMTTAVRERGDALFRAMAEAAQEAKMDPRDFDSLLSATLEASAVTDEIESLSKLALEGPAKYAKSVENYLNRAQSSLGTAEQILRSHGLGEVADELHNIGLTGILDEGVAAVFKPTAARRAKEGTAPEPIRWPLPHGHKMEDGRYIGYLDNLELQQALPKATKADAEAIEHLLDLRNRGLVKQAPRPAAPVLRQSPQGERSLVATGSAEEVALLGEGAPDFLNDDYLTDLGKTVAKLAAHTGEMQRLVRAGHDVAPEVIDGVRDSLQMYSELVEQTVRRGLGNKGNQVFDYLRETQREILRSAEAAGALTPGSPMAYLPRILNSGSRKALRQIIGEIPADVRAKMTPQLSGVFKRDFDQYSLGELNRAIRALDDVAPDADYTKKLREFAEEQGILTDKYTESPAEALLTRFAQAQQSRTTAEFVDEMLATARADFDKAPITGFEVSGYVNAKGQRRVFAKSKKAQRTTTTSEAGDVSTFRNQLVEEADSLRGLIVRDPDTGLESMLDMASLGGGYALLPVGTIGKTVGEAFAATAARGQGLSRVLETGRALSAEELSEMVGQRVVFGDKALVGGMVKQVSDQYKHTQGFWAKYDAVHSVVKAFQTVARPDFHVANFVSSMFQAAMTPGVGPQALTGGLLDTMRLMYAGDDVVKNFDSAARLLDTNGVGKLDFVRAVKRRGVVGSEANIGNAPFTSGTQVYNVDTIFREMSEQGLLGTFVSEGLRGSSSVSETLVRMREAAEAGKGRVREKLSNAAEASELVARTASVFAHLRAGYSVPTAVRMTQKAMVDYSNLTRFEQSVMKRAFSYYTFPRHYIPEAWRKFSEDPSKLSVLANSFQGLETAGVLSTQDGRAVLNLPNDYALDVSRLNAGADAMMMLPGLITAAQMSPTAQLEGAPGLAESSSFLQAGALLNLGYEAIDQDQAGDPSWLQEAARVTPVTRWLQTKFNGGNPDIEQGLAEQVMDALLPVRKKAPDHQRTITRARFMALQNDIIGKMTDASKRGDNEEVEFLRDELQQLGRTLRLLENR